MAGLRVSGSTSPDNEPLPTADGGLRPVKPFPIRSLVTSLILTLLLVGVLAWHLWTSYQGVQNTVGTDLNIQRLSGVVVHLDEVLTMSARMSAATGDLYWEQRYRTYEPQLDRAIVEVMRLAYDTPLEDASAATNEANTRLVEMEQRAFDLVRSGRREEAMSLLTGESYEEQKLSYAVGIKSISMALRERAAADLQSWRRALYLGLAAALATLPVLFVIWFVVLRGVRRHMAERTRTQKELERHREHLAELVEERTRQLNTANEELARRAQDLARTEARYRDLFENAPDLMAVLSVPGGEVIDCNQTLREALKLDRQDVVGRSFLSFYSPESRQAGAASFVAFAVEGRVSNAERTLQRSNGDTIEVLAGATPICDESGRIVAARCTWRDITTLKQAQREVARHVAALARSNAELEEFAYIASHDLQEPLRKILAFGDRLKLACRDALTDQGRDYLDRMLGAASRMQTLINDLLTYSRVTTLAQPYAPADLNTILREVLSDLEVRVEQTGARVEAGDLPTIQADPTQMRQLFQNLIGNALKFRRPEEAPQVRIHAESADGMCRITVQDNGIGFDPRYADRIFGVFQRLHGRAEYEGTGIGLAVCQKIAHRHGGEIIAHGEPGRGAAFTVSLPFEHRGNNE